jgi:hypothetical protein
MAISCRKNPGKPKATGWFEGFLLFPPGIPKRKDGEQSYGR